VVYAGDLAGRKHLEHAGISPRAYAPGKMSTNDVLVLGSGAGKELANEGVAIADFVKAGGNILAVGLAGQEANGFLPLTLTTKNAEHVSAFFEPFREDSLLVGISPADVHNRDPRTLPLVSGGATPVGDGVLGDAPNAHIVFCQLTPYDVSHTGGATGEPSNVRRTYRRASFLLTRLLANMGASGSTPILERFHSPVMTAKAESRFLDGLYLDVPEEWDDPYRFFCW
jgi:hypothetical protein